ncbi:MAG: hypothetical protein J0L82_08630 [Deltaproteobacteria bacterium]|jgi:hypothetical protein|nr:hypothetical protein [Deltaproteobacteria bacterium]
MKAVRITELDEITEFPVSYIVKADGSDEMVGCCPKAFFNFFGLLDAIDELKSSFLFWLKAELQEDDKTLITPPDGIRAFLKNPIFEKLDCRGGLIYDYDLPTFIFLLADGWVLLPFLVSNGKGQPLHCEVYYMSNGKLFCNGVEISTQTFVQKLYCDEDNRFIIGGKKGGED